MALPKSGVQLVAEAADRYIGDMGRANTATTAYIGTLGGAATATKGASQIMVGALHEVGAAAVEAGLQAAEAIGGFVKDSVGAAGDFEAGMLRFESVTGDSLAKAGLETEDFRQLFLQLGADTQYSAAQAEEAAIALAKGGVDPLAIANRTLADTLGLASAGELDLAQAADITAKQLGVWAETGVTSAQVADLLAQAANASTINVDELALGLANVGGTAKTAGVPFAELTQTMALIAPGFSSASDAGTSLKTFLSRLIPTTKDATVMMTTLGLATADGKSKFFDAQGAFIGMEQAARLLQGATKDLSQEERLLALNTVFGADAIRAADAIAVAGADGFRAMGESMANAGSASEQAAKKNKGWNFSVEQLQGSIETLQIVLGSRLLPTLGDLVDRYLTPGVNALTAFADKLFSASDPLGLLDDALNRVFPGLGSLARWFATTLPEAAGGATATIQQTLQPALAGMGTFLQGTVLPAVQDIVQWLAANLPQAIDTAARVWTETLQPAIAEVVAFAQEELLPAVQDMAAWLAANLPQAIDTAARVWTETLQPAIAEIVAVAREDLYPILKNLWAIALPLVSEALRVAASAWTNVLQPALAIVWDVLRHDVLPIVREVTDYLAVVLPPVIRFVGDILANYLLPMIGAVATLIDIVVLPVLRSLHQLIDGVLSFTLMGLAAIWETILEPAITGVADAIMRVAGPAFRWLQDTIIDPVGRAIAALSAKLNELFGWIGDVGAGLMNLQLPSWLTPGSPTPLEIGVDGINQAMRTLATTTLPSLQVGMERMTPVASANAIASAGTTTTHTDNSRTYHMPVYTTQSPAVVQQSMQIAEALAL